MKRAMLTGVALLALVSGEALATCGEPYMSEADVKTLLAGNTVCSPRNCSAGSCEWQEQHRGGPAGGELWDYKRGPGNTMDPEKKVGTWSITSSGGLVGAGKVTHSYKSGAFVYNVKEDGGNHSFCGANGEFTFSVKSGSVGC